MAEERRTDSCSGAASDVPACFESNADTPFVRSRRKRDMELKTLTNRAFDGLLRNTLSDLIRWTAEQENIAKEDAEEMICSSPLYKLITAPDVRFQSYDAVLLMLLQEKVESDLAQPRFVLLQAKND